ncbi:MAG: DUF975 family protein [Paludibacteraceae bacterium]|nr:DUF975 family protein [Paludibacteraceae bacterium]
MKQNFEYRKAALELLKGNWSSVIVISLFMFILECIAQTSFALFIPTEYNGITTLVANLLLFFPLVYVFKIHLLALSREGKKIVFSEYLTNLKKKYSRAVPVMGLICLYVMLWTILLVIPGIIKGYSYAMASYISIDNEELSAEECVQRSIKMMQGHKMQLFLLDLSFFGWVLLSILTLGIGLLWLAPYQETAHIKFYEDLKSKA